MQVIHLELITKASEIVIDPPLATLRDVVERLVLAIVESAQGLPRVEHVLFQDLQGYDMWIPTMEVHDDMVSAAKTRALKHITTNFSGPERLKAR